MATIIVAKKILSTRSPKLRLVCSLCSVRLNGVAVAYGWTCMCTVSNSTTSLPQYKACEHRLFLIRNSNNLPSGVPFSRSRQSWWFHVVVLQRTTKKLTKVQYARAELLFCPLDLSVIFCCFLCLSQENKLLHVITNNCVTATRKGYPVMERCDNIPEQIWEIQLNDLSKLTTKRPP